MSESDDETLAQELLAARASRRPLAPLAGRSADFSVARGYRVAAAIRRRRIAAGERPVGRKIGFTNRTIWPEYGVYAPIWGDMWDTTVRALDGVATAFDLSALVEPRIEPEIAFGLARAPAPGMDEAALFACIGWLAHGVEIVDSLFPGWRFQAADTVAAFGLHAAYLLGPRHAIGEGERRALFDALGHFAIDLSCDGRPVDRGEAGAVLGGPLSALRHLVDGLAREPSSRPLEAGEIVTTGTVTRAFPVKPGETWRTAIDGLPLPGLTIAFR